MLTYSHLFLSNVVKKISKGISSVGKTAEAVPTHAFVCTCNFRRFDQMNKNLDNI